MTFSGKSSGLVAAACAAIMLATSGCGTSAGSAGGASPEPSVSSAPPAPSSSLAPPASVATTPTTAPATETDWGNRLYDTVECGSITPIALVDGMFSKPESYVDVSLGQHVVLGTGDTLVVLHCIVGPSGHTNKTELLLFDPAANLLSQDYLPPGDPPIDSNGAGSIEYDVAGPNDPSCCASGRSRVSFAVVDRTIVVNEPEVLVAADGATPGNNDDTAENADGTVTTAPANTDDFPFDSFVLPQLGTEPVRGSGCGASGELGDTMPDGWWYGSVDNLTATSMDFDVECVYFGEPARELIQQCVDEMSDDDGTCTGVFSENFWPVNNSDRTRVVPVKTDAPRQLEQDGCPFEIAAQFESIIHVEAGQVVYIRAACPVS